MSDWASPSGDPKPEPHPQRPPGAAPEAPAPGHAAAQSGPPPAPRYGQYAPGAAPNPGYGPPPHYGPPGTQPPAQYGQPSPGPYRPAPGMPNLFAPKPGVIPLRPLTLGDILEGAFRTVRGNPAATLGLALGVSTLFAIPTVLLTILIANTPFGSNTTGDVMVQIANFASQIVGAVASILLSGMLIVVVAEAVLGHRASIGETWQRVKPRIWALLGATFLLVFAVALIIALVVGAGFLAYAAAGGVAAAIVAVIGAIGALVVIVWLGTRTLLAPAAITLEGLGPIAGLKRSWGLTRGQFWRILGISLLAQLIVGFIAGMIVVPAMIIAAGVLFATMQDSTADAAMPVWYLIVMQLVGVLATAITAPFSSSVTGLLYVDQRIRREALDLELMTAAGLK